jgi:MSHA biogenesis protein MshE
MMSALKNNDTSAFSDAARLSPDYKPLAHSALLYAKEGITSIDEVLKLVEMVGDMKDEDDTEHAAEDDIPAVLIPQPEPTQSTLSDSLQTDFGSSGLSLEDDN